MSPLRLLLVCLLVVVLVGTVALLDHRHKRAVENDAIEDRWFCVHRGIRCDGEDPETIARRWHARERGYKLAVAGVAVAGTFGLAGALRRRRADGTAKESLSK